MTSFQRFAPLSDFSTTSPSSLFLTLPFSRSPAATLSKIDMVGKGFGRWNTMPTVRRTATGSVPFAYRSRPLSSIVPSTRPPGMTSCIRLSVRRKVDLPHPDGPMKAVTDRDSMVIETSSTALNEP